MPVVWGLAVAFLRTPSHVGGLGFPPFFFFNLRFTLSTACRCKKILTIFHLICAERTAPPLPLFWVASSRFPREAPPVSTQSRADAEAARHCFLSCSVFALGSHLKNERNSSTFEWEICSEGRGKTSSLTKCTPQHLRGSLLHRLFHRTRWCLCEHTVGS